MSVHECANKHFDLMVFTTQNCVQGLAKCMKFGQSCSPTGGSSIKKSYKGHSQDPPTLVVKCKETLSRDVTWLRSDAFKNISSRDGLFKTQRFEIF